MLILPMQQRERTFHFRPGGVECDALGPSVAGFPLLTKGEDGRWKPRPADEIANDLAKVYGAPIDVSMKLSGLAAIAASLDGGDIARAQVATLLLQLPDPEVVNATAQKLQALFDAGWLGKDWDPARHPRLGGPPNAGWFADTDGGASSTTTDKLESSTAEPDKLPIVAAAVEEDDEKFPWEERDEDDEKTYFNPDTGEMTIAPPGVTLGPPWLRVPNISGPTYLQAPAAQTWISQNSLDRHYMDHADEFGARDVEEYAAKANEFYLESVNRGYRIKADANGTEYIYDPKTNSFSTYTADGRTITFFKPTPRDYWDRQPGFVVKHQTTLQLMKIEGGEMNDSSRFMCPVCGYPDLEFAPRTTTGAGSHEICACCGFQFGYHDESEGITYDEWRRRWVAALMPWKARTVRPPPGWNPVEQLRQVGRNHRIRSYEEFKRRYE